MAVTRRTFLKGTAATGGGVAAAAFLYNGFETLAVGQVAPATTGGAEELIKSTCWIGKQDCGLIARTDNGRVISLEGNPDNPRNLGRLCPKGVGQIASLYDSNRVMSPLVRTNEKGVSGTWREVTWDEAITLVATKMSEALKKDKHLATFIAGRSKVKPIYDKAFPDALGLKYKYPRRGEDCDGPAQNAAELTWGANSVMTPDLKYTKYLICYWGLTTSGGPGYCQISLPRQVHEAKERGMKVVAISPYQRPVAHFADEWVALKPGTDLALWLAVIHTLLKEGFIDKSFLNNFTNAAVLVRGDGSVFKAGDAEAVWDAGSGRPVAVGSISDPPLFGEFEIGGEKVKPALQVLKDSVEKNTPEWASEICDVPASQIKNIGLELGKNANIGSTTDVGGLKVPSRPVAYGVHGNAVKWHSALQTNRALLIAFSLLGAIESAGGTHFWEDELVDPKESTKKVVDNAGKDPLDRLDLGNSSWFPMGSSGYMMFPETVANPEKYKFAFKPEDMAILLHFINPILSTRPVDKAIAAWSKFGFVAVTTPFITATADLAADVILPCGTLDKWEGPFGVRTLYVSADTIHPPVSEPIGKSKSEIDIYIEIAEKMGKLYGPEGFIALINKELKIKDKYVLPLDKKPTAETVLNAWTMTKSDMPLSEFAKKGVVAKDIPPDKQYLVTGSKPFHGYRALFYQGDFVSISKKMKEKGAPQDLWSRWTPYPTWTEPAMEQSPSEYDLTLIDFKKIEFKQTRYDQTNPLLNELSPTNPLIMNPETAGERGLKDGDEVWVESNNPVSGETKRIKTVLATEESIRPDSVGITHHVDSPDLPTVNALLFYSEGFRDISSGWFSHAKVKVWKA